MTDFGEKACGSLKSLENVNGSPREKAKHRNNNNNLSKSHDLDERGSFETVSKSSANQSATDILEAHDSSDSASSFEEDLEFAKSFGIVLKGFKRSKTSNNIKEKEGNSSEISVDATPNNKTSRNDPIKIDRSLTTDCIYHRGSFYQKGDIVSLVDMNDNQRYFAQLEGFVQDQYCEKSAGLSWLVPTRPTSRSIFEPAAYKIGYRENKLRKLDCMTFVCHCPHDYYLEDKDYKAKFMLSTHRSSILRGDHSYIWTTLPNRTHQLSEGNQLSR